MGPLRPARPKRKKAAATTAPDKGATTTKALPLALLLLLLPTGAKCAHRNQTTCGHTSPQPPRFGVVKRLTASKTILETRQLNSPAYEPANTAVPLEFREQSPRAAAWPRERRRAETHGDARRRGFWGLSDVSSPGAVPFVGGSCFVAGAGRWRRFSALGSWTRICGRVHAVDDGAAAAR